MGKQSETPCAVFWRNRRRQKGIPPKADMPTIIPEHIYQEGRQLSILMMVPMLDWSPAMFEDIVTANKSGTDSLNRKPAVDHLKCACGCGIQHRNAVSGLEGEAGSRRVVWFRSLFCKNKYLGIGENRRGW